METLKGRIIMETLPYIMLMQFFAPTNTCKVRENKRIKDKSNQRKNISLRAKLIFFFLIRLSLAIIAIQDHVINIRVYLFLEV